jgi:hypothetical protein
LSCASSFSINGGNVDKILHEKIANARIRHKPASTKGGRIANIAHVRPISAGSLKPPTDLRVKEHILLARKGDYYELLGAK